jgi:hypothetical protein
MPLLSRFHPSIKTPSLALTVLGPYIWTAVVCPGPTAPTASSCSTFNLVVRQYVVVQQIAHPVHLISALGRKESLVDNARGLSITNVTVTGAEME